VILPQDAISVIVNLLTTWILPISNSPPPNRFLSRSATVFDRRQYWRL